MSGRNFLEFLDTETRISHFRIMSPEKMRSVSIDNINPSLKDKIKSIKDPKLKKLWEQLENEKEPRLRIEICAQIQILDDKDLESYTYMNYAYCKLKEFDLAEMKLEILKKIAPESFELFYCYARLHQEKKNFSESQIWWDRCLEKKPNDQNVLNNKGTALADLGKHEEAIIQYDKALEIDPNYEFALNNKGIALADLGKHEEAIKIGRAHV